MIPIKTESEIKLMKEGGKILAEVLAQITEKAKAGVSTIELDELAEKIIRKHRATPSFKGYHGFPATICIATNEIIVHGIPKKEIVLKEGDIFTVDCGVNYQGFHTDAARSIGIGKIDNQKQKLIDTAKRALSSAIDIVKPGIHLNEIGKIIQKIVEENGFHIVKDLTGHGIGKHLHEDPIILNFWDGQPGPILKEGMTLAIEPIFAIGTSQMKTLKDNWTIVTADNSPAVQEENTILITQNGSEILTN